MPTHNPARKRGRWRVKRRTHHVSPAAAAAPRDIEATYEYPFGDTDQTCIYQDLPCLVEPEPEPKTIGTLREMALLM